MRQWTVDAFASAPFKGNPACVVEPFDRWPSD
ncbi:MAG TPA: isomerase, partial [Brevundimonas sp.]